MVCFIAVLAAGCGTTAPFSKTQGPAYAYIEANGVQTVDQADPGIVGALTTLSKEAITLGAAYGPFGWVWAIPQTLSAIKSDVQTGTWRMVGAGYPSKMTAKLEQSFDVAGKLVQSVPSMEIEYHDPVTNEKPKLAEEGPPE